MNAPTTVDPATPLVRVRGLKMHFATRGGTVRAVDGINLDLRQGETLGVVGESGCGKSTAGRAMLQLLKPTAGTVEIGGREITALWRKRFGRWSWGPELRELRRDAQLVFQDPYASLDPRMTVEAIVSEPLSAFRVGTETERRRKVHLALERVGMDPRYLRRYPHEFSGGQRQRIGIARALVLQPKLIVCDEPVSALDVSVQAQIINLLEQLQRDLGLTYLLIAHDLAVVRHISQRVAVMYLGRVVEFADCNTLYDRPAHPYTRALLSSVPIVDPTQDRTADRSRKRLVLLGDVPSPVNPPSGCHFHTRCPHVIERCRSESPQLRALPRRALPSLASSDAQLVACHRAEELS